MQFIGLEALDLSSSKHQEPNYGRSREEEITQDKDHAQEDSAVQDAAESLAEDLITESPDEESAEAGPEQMWQAKVADLEDRLLRVHADFDNFRRRTRQEKEELLNLANTKLIGELLPVLDNFALALQAAESSGDAGSIAKGVGMVYKQLFSLLENMGLRQMDPIGQAFDPSLHEAVMSESTEDREPGIVIAVMRSGFYFKDKVLRPAMVKVSE